MGLACLTMAEIERRAIIETINACGGNRAQSARKLGVSEKTDQTSSNSAALPETELSFTRSEGSHRA